MRTLVTTRASLGVAVLCIGVDLVEASRTALVFGLGPGLVALVVLAIVCVVICGVGYSAENKTRFLIPVAVIIGGTTLFFASVDIENPSDASQTTTTYNRVTIARSAVAGIMIGFTVLSCFSVLLMHVITPRQGHLIGDATGRRPSHARVF